MDKVFKYLNMLVLLAGAISLLRVADLQTRDAGNRDSVLYIYSKTSASKSGRYSTSNYYETRYYLDLIAEKKLRIDGEFYDSLRPPEKVQVQRTWLYSEPVVVIFDRTSGELRMEIIYIWLYVICVYNIILAILVLINRDFSLGAAMFVVLGNLVYWAISTS